MSKEVGKPLGILLIEDEEIDDFIHRRLIEKCLSGTPIEILSFEHAIDAIDYLLKIQATNEISLPDYIFLDLHMQGMDGWEFLDEYGKHNIDPMGKTKLYIVSSTLFSKDFFKAHTYSKVKQIISKPIALADMEAIFEVKVR
jgi:CheY-like chemotaxis protein